MYDSYVAVSGEHDVMYDRVMLWPVACMMSYVRYSYIVISGVHDVLCRVMLWSVAHVTSDIVMLWPVVCVMSYVR